MRNFFLLMCFSTFLASSGVNAERWSKIIGGPAWDWGECVLQTSDGGYIVTGGTSSWGEGATDLLLVKTGPQGDTLWRKTYGKQFDDYGVKIKECGSSSYFILGQSSDNSKKVWLLKINTAGDTLWTALYQNDSTSYGEVLDALGYDFIVTDDGGCVIVGEAYITADTTNLWLFKVDSSGKFLWGKIYGAEGYDRAEGIAPTSNGGFMIVGATQLYGVAQNDLWLLRMDSLGDTLWTKTYGDPDYDWGSSIKPLEDGGFIIAAQKRIYGENQYNGWLVRIDSLGDTLWTRICGKGGWDRFNDVEPIKDGGFIIAGETNSYTKNDTTPSVWLVKTNANGWNLWSRTFGGQDWDWGRYVQESSDGSYIVTGGTCSFGAGEADLWLLKTDADGYVTVLEQPSSTSPTAFEVISSVGSKITLRFSDMPKGFRAQVFDASGRKVDEIFNTSVSGTLVWGECYGPGVYFIVPDGNRVQTQKIILVK